MLFALSKIVLAGVAWVVLTVALTAGWIYVQNMQAFAGAGSGGIGAVSMGIESLLPPALLAALIVAGTWTFFQRS